MAGPIDPPRLIAKQIAFNCVPQIDRFEDNGYTKEEMKMLWETQKIMEDPSIRVNATAVRVPVFYGHSEAVHIETQRKISAAEARALLEKAPGVAVLDERRPGGYPTAVTEAANHDTVYVGRIREDMSHERGLDLWIVVRQHPQGRGHQQRADRRDFGSRVFISYIAAQIGADLVFASNYMFYKDYSAALVRWETRCSSVIFARRCCWHCCRPAATLALGLGDIHLKSSLNAPLDADIDLVGASAEDLAGLKATLASARGVQPLRWPGLPDVSAGH